MWIEINRIGCSRMLLNSSKTDFLWCSTHRRCNQHRSAGSLRGACATDWYGPRSWHKPTVLEADKQMTGHVRQLVSRCFRQLRLIKSCVRSLPFEAAKTTVA